MKKLLLFVIIGTVTLSCGTPKTVIQAKRVMKGEWLLNNITYSKSGTYKVELLQDTSKECFEGSNWRFIPNNNSGLYAINDTNCSVGERNFIFTVQEIDPQTGLYDFLLKPTTKLGRADKQKTSGFRLQLVQLTESTMQWKQTVNQGGEPFSITMNFIKNQ